MLINCTNDLFYYELGSDKAVRVTNSPEEEVGETFSPDDRMIGFVRNNNMYVYDLATQRERRLTTDGSPKILNGRLDWVYQEELYGRGNFEAYWWSPDSTMLAYLRLDENPVPEFTVVDHIPYHQNRRSYSLSKSRRSESNGSTWRGQRGGRRDALGRYLQISTERFSDRARVLDTGQQEGGLSGAESRTDISGSEFRGCTRRQVNHVFRETSKAWVEVIDNPTLAEGWIVSLAERAQWLAASLSLRAGWQACSAGDRWQVGSAIAGRCRRREGT